MPLRALPWLVLGVLLAAVVGAALRAELGPAGQWACSWSVARDGWPAPDVRGLTVGQAREALRAERACLGLRVVARRLAPAPAGSVVHQHPAPGHAMDRTLEVVVSLGEHAPAIP